MRAIPLSACAPHLLLHALSHLFLRARHISSECTNPGRVDCFSNVSGQNSLTSGSSGSSNVGKLRKVRCCGSQVKSRITPRKNIKQTAAKNTGPAHGVGGLCECMRCFSSWKAAWAECTCAGAARLATFLFLSQSSMRFLASLCISHVRRRRAWKCNDTGA